MGSKREATIDDLRHVEGKAEIVNGELVLMSAAGYRHGFVSLEIAASLREYTKRTGSGHALADSVGFIVNLPHRRSFSPDAAFATQPFTDYFVDGAPVFAVEVRESGRFRSRSRACHGGQARRLFCGRNPRRLGRGYPEGLRCSRLPRQRSHSSRNLRSRRPRRRGARGAWLVNACRRLVPQLMKVRLTAHPTYDLAHSARP